MIHKVVQLNTDIIDGWKDLVLNNLSYHEYLHKSLTDEILDECRYNIFMLMRFVDKNTHYHCGIIGCRRLFLNETDAIDIPYHTRKNDSVYKIEFLQYSPAIRRFNDPDLTEFNKEGLNRLLHECLAGKNDSHIILDSRCFINEEYEDYMKVLNHNGFVPYDKTKDGSTTYIKSPDFKHVIDQRNLILH